MSTVEFNYNGSITKIQCSEDEIMEKICQRFATKSDINIKDLCFLYSGSTINIKSKYSQIMSTFDKDRKTISLLVCEKDSDNQNKDQNLVKSVYPICPICSENMKLEINDYKINLKGCKNGHSIKMNIDEYDNNQRIDLSKIECNICKTNKNNTYNNEIYLCNICKIILCPLCKTKHNKDHNLINYDLKNYICSKHNESYISYCKDCKIDICLKCQKEHIKHKMILFGEILPDTNELLKKLKYFQNIKNIFNNFIERIIYQLNNVKENIEILYNIYSDMLHKYEDKYRNYEIFMSLENINNNNIINDLKRINKIENINNKLENILNIYEKINFSNEITMIYNLNNEEKIKIFGKKFVDANKGLCKLIYENKEYELTEEFNVKNINKKN